MVPNPATATPYAITAISSKGVWAVGAQVTLHWNGASWSAVSFPLPPGNNPSAVLKGVSAGSADDIWAVGYDQRVYFSDYLSAPVTYHWNGTSWSLVYNAGTTNEYLNGVVAITANDVWGVGDNGQMQHWNGAAWSRVSSPYLGVGGRLNDVAAVSAGDIWAVGHYGGTNGQLTWVDRHTIP